MTVGTFLLLVFFAGCAAIFLMLAKTVKARSDNATFDHDFQRFMATRTRALPCRRHAQ